MSTEKRSTSLDRDDTSLPSDAPGTTASTALPASVLSPAAASSESAHATKRQRKDDDATETTTSAAATAATAATAASADYVELAASALRTQPLVFTVERQVLSARCGTLLLARLPT